MKLTQLQEARYYIHPVVDKVEQIADDLESGKIEDEYGFVIEDVETITRELDRKYERLNDVAGWGDEDVLNWKIRSLSNSTIEIKAIITYAVAWDETTGTTYGEKPHLVVYLG